MRYGGNSPLAPDAITQVRLDGDREIRVPASLSHLLHSVGGTGWGDSWQSAILEGGEAARDQIEGFSRLSAAYSS